MDKNKLLIAVVFVAVILGVVFLVGKLISGATFLASGALNTALAIIVIIALVIIVVWMFIYAKKNNKKK